MSRTVHACLVSVALTVGLSAQTTHLVGPGGFATIQAAVNAAAPGDRVDVTSGTYLGFTCNKQLRIRALGPVTLGLNVLQPGHVTLNPPAGATVDLVGFTLMRLTVTDGRATVDSCLVQHGAVVSNAQLHMQASTCYGDPGLQATNATVTATDCTFTGPPLVAWTDGPVVRLSASRLHASHTGVLPGNFFQGVGTYMVAERSSTAWLADGRFGGSTPGHCPLTIDSSSVVRADRTSYSVGGPGCQAPAPGLLLGIERATPLLVGQVFELRFTTAPNALVGLWASPGLGHVEWGPVLEQPSWLDPQNAFPATLLVADPTGSATASFPIPAGPAIVGQALWFTGVSGVTLPLQASAPVGGVAR